MSDFQLGLLAISAVILVAVIAYNKWEEWRLRRRTEAAFGAGHKDVLLDAEGSGAAQNPQPPLSAAADFASAAAPEYVAPAPDADAPLDHTLEHTLGVPELDEAVTLPPPIEAVAAAPYKPFNFPATSTVPRLARLDPDIDFIVQMQFARPLDGGAVLVKADELFDEALLELVHWEGFNDSQAAWEVAQSAHSYTHVRTGLQLANRHGAVSKQNFAAFQDAMQAFALDAAAQIEMSDPDEALQRAAHLDAFCADYAIQIGLSVFGREGQSLAGTKLRALAESAGCRLDKDGCFRKFTDDGAELYSLSNTEPMPFHGETLKTLATRGVTVLFDVPRAPGSAAAFRAYIDFARHVAQVLDGVLLDDDRKAIGQAAIDQIGAQLTQIHQAMATRGIPAGSPAALRLFA